MKDTITGNSILFCLRFSSLALTSPRIDSVYIPWFQALKSHVLAKFPLPEGNLPIPDDELLPPKYPISVDAMHPVLEDVKSAALSHVDRPKLGAMQQDDEDIRRQSPDGFGQYAREGGRKSDYLTYHGRLNADKDNILKDHPEKYNIDQRVSTESALPPSKYIHAPRTWDSIVVDIKRVTPESHWQDVRLLKIRLEKNPDWNEDRIPCLQPGDLVEIWPKNYPADVQALVNMMDWQSVADKKVVWKSGTDKPCRPRNLYPVAEATFRDILLHNLDINAIPNRTFLSQLRRHTRSDLEKERLFELTQESNTQEFYDYTSRPRRTILEVLQDFPGVKIPIEYALETFPVIRPRAFSIANCLSEHQEPDAYDRLVEILVALVEYKTIIRKPRQVSRWRHFPDAAY